MEDIRDSGSQRQAEIFQKLESHPIHLRMNGLGRGKLERSTNQGKSKKKIWTKSRDIKII
jgi:hypothetical protein